MNEIKKEFMSCSPSCQKRFDEALTKAEKEMDIARLQCSDAITYAVKQERKAIIEKIEKEFERCDERDTGWLHIETNKWEKLKEKP